MKTKKKDMSKQYTKEVNKLSDEQIVFEIKDNLDYYLGKSVDIQQIAGRLQKVNQDKQEYLKSEKVKQKKIDKFNKKAEKIKAEYDKKYEDIKAKEGKYEALLAGIEKRVGFKVNPINIYSVILAIIKLTK
jgi:hypothetical protein